MHAALIVHRAIFVVGAALTALAMLAAPASAAGVARDGPTASFSVRGSHGYPIAVSVENGSASVFVRDPAVTGDSYSTASYHADEGKVGKVWTRVEIRSQLLVRARFEPSGGTKRGRTPPGCKGGLRERRFGHFVGRIVFYGEGGYTVLRRTRVPGTLTFASQLNCPPSRPGSRAPLALPWEPGSSRGPARRVTRFEASARSSGLYFAAGRKPSRPDSALLVALSVEDRVGFDALRETVLSAPAAAFAFDPGLSSATIAPPYPYAGSASFQRLDAYTSRWEGPLTISFPGRPNTPLTGREFSWGLSSARERGASYLHVGNVLHSIGDWAR
ncbi:MAG TPA: hypothetical protein VMS60_11160 [Solirubrobacterales bacterium]|nr:hypothetical protein [Solirubrobacterales bacterium]